MTYTWNEAGVRFANDGGRIVGREKVRAEVDRALRVAGNRAIKVSEDLRAGRINLATWRQRMRDIVKETHLYSAAAAKGGWGQMTDADYGRVGQILAHGPRGGKGQYQYLEGFSREIQNGLALDGRFIARTKMYSEAARTTYHTFDERVHRAEGFDEERSIRHAGDSCTGCIEAEVLEWQPIGTLPRIGERTCLANCNCTMEYRISGASSGKPAIDRRNPDRALQSASDRVVSLYKDLAEGRMSLADWRRAMRTILRETGLA